MSQETRAAVVLLSGGIDSSVLMRMVRSQTTQCHALCFHYGQRHAREMECARYQAAASAADSFELLDIGGVGRLLQGGSTLIEGGAPVPQLSDLSPEMRAQPPTYVPNRNMFLLSIAAAYAEAIGAERVCYGAQAQDEYGYWDCTPAFLERVNAVLALNRRHRIIVEAPLMNNSKADNIRLGLRLGVDFAHSWSCYRGETKACGLCPTCVERCKAFAEVGTPDPLPYTTVPHEGASLTSWEEYDTNQ